ncbi:site-specific integrase [Roseovarius sp. MMSF_3350]|uniref:tyrosine-type recombinase/integrase n=1 Tax=Roseovarius sp. MMSF_3350 TaxID=3046706 RepID=UPI00273F3AF9|nr:site-specific integrase [Roseovarius sp. MMSF_3350]
MATVYKRGDIWWVRFQWRGKEIRKSAKTTVKREAREYLAELQSQYRRLDHGGRPRIPFEQAAIAYIEEHVSRKKLSTISFYQNCLSVLQEEFGQNYLDEITRGKIASFEAKKLRTLSPARVKHYRATLSGLFKVALNHEWIDANPCRDLKPITLQNARFRFLTKREWQALKSALPEPWKSVAEMSVLRGMRLGEILNMKWADIDEITDTITLPDTKSGRPRTIPLENAVDVLDRQPSQTGRWVFSNAKGRPFRVDNASKRINKIARDVGIKDFTTHDLRHTFASWYVQRGGDLYRLQLILGHTGPAMTQRYAHLRVDDLRETRTKTGTLH